LISASAVSHAEAIYSRGSWPRMVGKGRSDLGRPLGGVSPELRPSGKWWRGHGAGMGCAPQTVL